jgi:hypothetical protein
MSNGLPSRTTVCGWRSGRAGRKEASAQKLSVNLIVAPVTAAAELEAAFTQLIAKGAQGVVVQQDPGFYETARSPNLVNARRTVHFPAMLHQPGFLASADFAKR